MDIVHDLTDFDNRHNGHRQAARCQRTWHRHGTMRELGAQAEIEMAKYTEQEWKALCRDEKKLDAVWDEIEKRAEVFTTCTNAALCHLRDASGATLDVCNDCAKVLGRCEGMRETSGGALVQCSNVGKKYEPRQVFRQDESGAWLPQRCRRITFCDECKEAYNVARAAWCKEGALSWSEWNRCTKPATTERGYCEEHHFDLSPPPEFATKIDIYTLEVFECERGIKLVAPGGELPECEEDYPIISEGYAWFAWWADYEPWLTEQRVKRQIKAKSDGVTLRDLALNLNGLDRQEIKEALAFLVDSGEVQQAERRGKRGPATVVYMAK